MHWILLHYLNPLHPSFHHVSTIISEYRSHCDCMQSNTKKRREMSSAELNESWRWLISFNFDSFASDDNNIMLAMSLVNNISLSSQLFLQFNDVWSTFSPHSHSSSSRCRRPSHKRYGNANKLFNSFGCPFPTHSTWKCFITSSHERCFYHLNAGLSWLITTTKCAPVDWAGK